MRNRHRYIRKYQIARNNFWWHGLQPWHRSWVQWKGWVLSMDMSDKDWLNRWTP